MRTFAVLTTLATLSPWVLTASAHAASWSH